MAEPIHLRVRRLLSASAEETLDALERAGGASVMREAIRQVERALDEVRAEQDAAIARGRQAKRRQDHLRAQVAGLEEKARFALGKGRDDLAEAALSRQIDFEAQAKLLEGVEAEAAGEAARMEECVAALDARRAQMQSELAAFEAARRDAAPPSCAADGREQKIKRDVARAARTFDRVMANAGGVGRADAEAAAKVAEIDALRKSAELADRIAALRAASQPS